MLLNKYLAYTGFTSRRKAVELIKTGHVRVNGIVETMPHYVVKPTDTITLDGIPLRVVQKKLYILMNKPTDCVSTLSDEQGKRTVIDLLKPKIKERVYPVGRLDRHTTGVLLLTNDGELAHTLAHPRFEVEKIYKVVLDRPCHQKDIDQLLKGIRLYDGVTVADAVYVDRASRSTKLTVKLHSGKNRIIRRMFTALGYHVRKLDRIEYAGLTKKGVPVGTWRYLTQKEVQQLQNMTNILQKDKNTKGKNGRYHRS